MGPGSESPRGNKLSLYTATCLVVANMVGTGVFTSLYFQLGAGLSPFSILALWFIGGICAFCGGVCYAELAAAMPRSGGEYHLLARVYHPAIGFLAGWVTITVGFAAPVALGAMAFGEYLKGIWPWISAGIAAAASVGGVTILLIAHPRSRVWFQDGATSLKVILLFAFLVAGCMSAGAGTRLGPSEGDGAQLVSKAFAVSLVYVMYAYSGWNAASYVTGEVENASRNVPMAMAIGTGVVMILYVGVNAVFLYVTPLRELGAKIDVGLTAGTHIFGMQGGRWMAMLIALGLLSNIGAMQWIGPRVLATMGEDHRPLRWFAAVNRHRIPVIATVGQTAIVAYLLITASFEQVLIYVQFTLTLSSFFTVLGVWVMRRTHPDLPRPVRAWGYPATMVIFLTVTGWMLWHILLEKPRESVAGLATTLLGLIVFYISKRRS